MNTPLPKTHAFREHASGAHALPDGPAGRILACAVTFIGIFGIGLLATTLLSLYRDRAAVLADRRALLAHTEQSVSRIPALKRRYQEARDSASGAHVLLPGANDSEAAADLSQNVQAIAAREGIEIASQETVPPRRLGRFHAIGVRVALTGDWPAFIALLDDLDRAAPRLLVENLDIRRARAVTDATRERQGAVESSLTITGFRAADLRPSPTP